LIARRGNRPFGSAAARPIRQQAQAVDEELIRKSLAVKIHFDG
jgi:hypothetical protein